MNIFANMHVGVGGIFLLSIPVASFCLGTWQVKRRTWKLDLIAKLNEKLHCVPIEFSKVNLDSLDELEFMKVKVSGSFDHSKEMLYGPRSLLVKGARSPMSGGLISTGQSGYNIVTPFTLSNEKISILVNRGWVHHKFKKPSTRPKGQIEGQVQLTGIVRLQEKHSPFIPKDNPDGLFIIRDVLRMSEQAGTSPVFIDAVESVDGGPKGSQTIAALRNEHVSYLITWYTLSLLTSFLWIKKYILKKG